MNARVAPSNATVHALDAVNVAGTAVSFINDSIHPLISALVELANLDGRDETAMRMRLSLIYDLAKVGRNLVEDAAGCLEMERDTMQAKLDALESHN